ncbi:Acetylornithine deacetylase/Succinyl-diaminopimelate desuccinylase [Kytococcus aerolatus]|uniref:Acetylornithine deacetylase/Succinyl-diaminopimelate desuccinylase n=1 Tax=Kytococcus aerolatus TaxID=592308 RepID=A0A212T1H2_9MICO|nr:M20/M25/M40 family metallo-hydrolase [Kytococcus aerolatus]SNC59887.1 Acetylornithine deacetylase/Succinyl-diaminopimelate desuccinylase [Kytococcus aerolatus]
MDTTAQPQSVPAPADEVVELCRELIRIDTTNFGDGSGPGEAEAAAWVVERLREVGLEPQVFESDPGRTSVVVRLEGEDRDRPGLVLHGHLDVVPAEAEDWSVDPFAAEIRDGMVWGRGAVDMKDMDAMILAVVRHLARTGTKPARDLVVAFFADEEAGGVKGAGHLVDHHPELFDGCTEAVSEVGGFSITVPGQDVPEGEEPRRTFLVQTAEKGKVWLTLTAHGTAGHGSVPTQDNAVAHMARALAALHDHEWPAETIESVRLLLEGVGEQAGVDWSVEDPVSLAEVVNATGGARAFVSGTLRNTFNPTMVNGGYKHNVVPQTVTAGLDCRYLPGQEEHLMETVRELCGPKVEVAVHNAGTSLEAPFDAPLVERMTAALRAEDPDCEVLPYCLSGGTDNKHLSRLGITGYGFVPLALPADLDFAPLFHGVDERVPLDALEFGARVLHRFVLDC